MSGGQLHIYVEGRLARWRVWYHSGKNPKPARVSSWWGPCVINPNVEQPGNTINIRVDTPEAEETDLAVRALPVDLQDAIYEVWTKGGTMEQKARSLRLTRDGLYRRLDRAHTELLGLFNDQAAGIRLTIIHRKLKFA